MGRSGVTLAEVVLAIGFLAVVMLSLLTVFTRLLGSQTQTAHQVVARCLAQRVLEEAVQDGPPLWGVADPTQPTTVELHVQDSETREKYTYWVRASLLRDAPPATPMGKLYLVEVEVTWWTDQPGQTRRETGKLSLKTGRAVYVEE
ncbi:MAG: hypothetical protein HY319_29220 [Armatimonadetes bacterium]|nr:hypothetical protein [Armatimonadota bacterium]